MSWAMRPLAVGLAFAFAGCGGTDVARQAPVQAPHVLVSIADVADDVCGTSCPVFSEQVVRLAPDGTFAAVADPVLHYGPGAQARGVHVGSKAVLVRWRSGESMSVPIAHFGPAPRLKWSPGGLRFAVL